MEDKILEKFFEPARWEHAMTKGVDKDIRRADLLWLTNPENRMKMYRAIKDGSYEIAPPYSAKIPKDKPGEYRTVYINEPIDRILLSITNDLLFELTPDAIHPRCKSYLKGIGCGMVVQEASRAICGTKGEVIGFKSDLSKYFDSVPIERIDEAFDMVEEKHGKSSLIDVLRKYYHSALYYDSEENRYVREYKSLKQGCSVAAWLADVVLYSIDEKLSKLDGYYVRYSDDMLFIGNDYKKAMDILKNDMESLGIRLNDKKTEWLTHTRWFKFLGFAIKGASISLASSRIKTFKSEIEKRTIRNRDTTYVRARNSIIRYLYKGNGEFSWATQVLPVINVKQDVNELDKFVMDCLRAVKTNRRKVGGIGYNGSGADGCVTRGTGRNVTANRLKLPELDGYVTLSCMQNAIKINKHVYNSLVDSL